MKGLKKVLSVALATAVAMTSALAFSTTYAFAAQDASTLKAGTAHLNVNQAGWGAFTADWENATITGDGTYTVSMKASSAIDLEQFNALDIVDGDEKFGHTYVVTIDSISINGKAVKMQGESYTCTADAKGVTTRVNIYNEWNSPTDADVIRTAGDLSKATAKLITDANRKGVSSMEVKFTISGLGGEAASDDASSDDSSATELKTQKITNITKSKSYKATTLAKAKKTFKIGATAQGAVSYKAAKDSTKSVSISKKGVVTVKKGTKAGTYKVKTTITAKATSEYAKATKTITVKVVVK